MIPKSKYIYDNGFSKRVYICQSCHSHRLIQKPSGGLTPPTYVCDGCGNTSHAPKWINEPFIDDATLGRLQAIEIQMN